MNLILKIFKLFALIIVTFFIILFTASLLLQDRVAGIVLKSLNKNISTRLDAGSVKLTFLRKFPKASLELKNVIVHSSSGFNKSLFRGINTDTLLAARNVSVEFSITDILKGNYNIERIGARTGIVNFFTDPSGNVNYDISVKTSNQASGDFTINLEKINLTNIKVNYNNLSDSLIIKGVVKNARLKSRISGKDIDFTASSQVQIESIQLYSTLINNDITADLDVTLRSSRSGILLKKGILRIENYDFGLSGFISSDNVVDLNITGHNFNIEQIRHYLPEKYVKLVSEYNPSGILIINSKIKGLLSRTSNPHIEINWLLKKGQVSYGKSDLSIKDLSFSGYYSNGSGNRPETSSISINDVKARLGSSDYSGSFSLNGFNHPRVSILLKGKVFPEELKEFFDLKKISAAGGSFDLDLKVENKLIVKKTYDFSDLIDLKPEATMNFNSFTIGFQNNKLLFNDVNGNLIISGTIHANNFRFTYKGQKIKVDGKFENFPEWLEGRPVRLIASADVTFSSFIPELFLNDPASSGTSDIRKPAYMLPDDMILDINFKIDSLKYKLFSSSNVAGTLNYKSRLITFKSFNMKSLEGVISGNGFIVQNHTKAYVVRANINVSHIDVNKAFNTFHNFGQDFLKAENIKGNLSGSLSLLLPMDSLMNPQISSVTAEGKFLLSNGALINFDPVKQLSSFIELSELENISFDKMENDFFIRNNSLYIPQMDVKSSAADLSVNGKHSFDNNYEYHVKMLLSEILSRKRKKNKSNITEFGEVQDDGLGRTSFLLKITGKGEEVKVTYDIKAAGSQLKNNIKSERQTLKGILNQEYGWYKSDTSIKQKPVVKKSRFRINWEETDSLKTKPDAPAEKNESVLKNLFKRN
jgi:hypothetical protein